MPNKNEEELKEWEIEFDEKWFELKRDNNFENGETKSHEFGYRIERPGENHAEIYTLVDIRNIKDFICSKISQAYAQGKRDGDL